MGANEQPRAAGHVTGEAIPISIGCFNKDDAFSVGANHREGGWSHSSGSTRRVEKKPYLTSLKRDRVKPEKFEFAKDLRKRQTPAESVLWNRLRRHRGSVGVFGVRVKRQVVIYGYIVDFWIPSWRLVIELDGDSHVGREEYDRHRDEALTSMGITVLRFRNEEVFEDIDGVLERIERAVA